MKYIFLVLIFFISSCSHVKNVDIDMGQPLPKNFLGGWVSNSQPFAYNISNDNVMSLWGSAWWDDKKFFINDIYYKVIEYNKVENIVFILIREPAVDYDKSNLSDRTIYKNNKWNYEYIRLGPAPSNILKKRQILWCKGRYYERPDGQFKDDVDYWNDISVKEHIDAIKQMSFYEYSYDEKNVYTGDGGGCYSFNTYHEEKDIIYERK